MNYEARIARVRDRLSDEGVDALLVMNLINVAYLTGFTGSNGQVLVTAHDAVFFSDPRYEARAADLVQGAEVAIYPTKLTELLPDHLQRASISRLGIEAKTMTIAQRDDLAGKLSVTLAATGGVVEGLRRSKDRGEVDALRRAVQIGDEALSWVLDRLVPGAVERDIALELEVHMRQHGAEAVSFEPIVGSGPLSAHIHHSPSDRPFEKGDLILVDFGCRYDGYCSDLTRTVVLGPATDDQKQLYATVLEAQRRGIEAATVGRKTADVDAAARKVIDDAGHGDRFGHGLGHGVGLEVHEAPRLHRTSDETLTAGDVVTVEPGIYIRGSQGIRIEDCVLVTDDGPDVLGSAPKHELIEL